MAHRSSVKLAPRFFGPYEILTNVGYVAYRLALLQGSRIHNVFHVSMLQKNFDSVSVTPPPLPSVDESTLSVLPQLEPMLDRRVVQNGNYQPKYEVLVKWQGAPVEDATWENVWRMARS